MFIGVIGMFQQDPASCHTSNLQKYFCKKKKVLDWPGKYHQKFVEHCERGTRLKWTVQPKENWLRKSKVWFYDDNTKIV